MLSRKSWFVALCLLVAACSDGHDALSSEVQALSFGDSFEFLVERRVGPEQCIMGDCPAIVRYHLSDQEPNHTCLELAAILEGDGLLPDRTLGAEACRWLGSVGGLRLDVRATDPITEIPPDDQTLGAFPVDSPHAAVVVIRATRNE